MSVENWDEIRTAYQVARLGTVSGAAQVLGVHHATVIRHIDALESNLGVKLFQRHARGYTPTEAGSDLLLVAQTTDEQFSQLVSRIKGRGTAISGELVITALSGIAEAFAPVIAEFQAEHPDVLVRYLADERVFRLEYGEAHVALRAGKPPQEPDNVVQPFHTHQIGLYASDKYVERHGLPAPDRVWEEARFIAHDDVQSRAPFMLWLRENVTPNRIVFQTTDANALKEAVLAGIGMGFMPTWQAAKCSGLVQVVAPRPEWESQNWLVTHVDLHRTPKVQAFLTYLKAATKDLFSED
ncbi:LysR family transcriptional regulator [Celeribacter arenosi]|uniref:LysR family transcriptional regulator n=1 Tax=Celeribacter arenosi TaxID=792649 RepID=A0ABP7K5K1_9RHOB